MREQERETIVLPSKRKNSASIAAIPALAAARIPATTRNAPAAPLQATTAVTITRTASTEATSVVPCRPNGEASATSSTQAAATATVANSITAVVHSSASTNPLERAVPADGLATFHPRPLEVTKLSHPVATWQVRMSAT